MIRSVTGFLILYFASCGLGHFLLTFGEVDLETSMSASIATLGNIGPGLLAVGRPATSPLVGFWIEGRGS